MALETLKGIKEIGGFRVCDCDNDSHVPSIYIHAEYSNNFIAFKLQDGPIKENGEEGCQVDTIIETAKLIIEGLNKKFPCRENEQAVSKLEEALDWLAQRREDRISRGVEGTSNN